MDLDKKQYKKAFIPLESEPSVLSDLMYALGVSRQLALTDVWSIDDPVQLYCVPRPVYALVLVLPDSAEYERHRLSGAVADDTASDRRGQPVIWFRQTIDNACGLYAILHATVNAETSKYIVPGSFLSQLTAASREEQASLLEGSAELETIYQNAALRGGTVPPPPDEEVDSHYVCFIKSANGSVYEMDGDANGPVETEVTLGEDKDLLDPSVLDYVRKCIARGEGNMNFSLLALTRQADDSG